MLTSAITWKKTDILQNFVTKAFHKIPT